MILLPNCKINVGLDIVERRPDGYHNLRSVFIPGPLKDILEIVPSRDNTTHLITSGNDVGCRPEDNLVMKAVRAMEKHLGRSLPDVDIYLHKQIPDGAGLGGGSSDAAFTLIGLNELFDLKLDKETLAEIAATVGSDCPFFIYNRPMLATGTGTTLSPVEIQDLDQYRIEIVKPPVSISTREAYSRVKPQIPDSPTADMVAFEQWRDAGIKNDFEESVFAIYPEVAELKQAFYDRGAVYASMSGSGSAVFGIFKKSNEESQSFQTGS